VPITTLDKEAAKVALDRWKPTKLGESYYVKKTLAGHTTLCEFRNLHVRLTPHALSQADKLNGIGYQAEISLFADVVRTYQQEPFPTDKGWSQWSDGTSGRGIGGWPTFSTVQELNGKWRVDDEIPGVTSYVQYKQLEPSDLPK
jgi:hypothetical protein